jgi:hypothetical protein
VIWLVYGILTVGGFYVCRWRSWCIVVVGRICVLAMIGGIHERWDPFVGDPYAEKLNRIETKGFLPPRSSRP